MLSTDEAQAEIIADEERLFDRDLIRSYTVEEYESEMPAVQAALKSVVPSLLAGPEFSNQPSASGCYRLPLLLEQAFRVFAELLFNLLAPNLHGWRQDLVLNAPWRCAEDHGANARVLFDLIVDALHRGQRRGQLLWGRLRAGSFTTVTITVLSNRGPAGIAVRSERSRQTNPRWEAVRQTCLGSF